MKNTYGLMLLSLLDAMFCVPADAGNFSAFLSQPLLPVFKGPVEKNPGSPVDETHLLSFFYKRFCIKTPRSLRTK